jgi:hypothetical protein
LAQKEKKANNYELKDFYRAKDSPADIQIGKNPDVLRRLETKYYVELYWSLDQKSMPKMVKFLQEEEEKYNSQLNMYTDSSNSNQGSISVRSDLNSVYTVRDKVQLYK